MSLIIKSVDEKPTRVGQIIKRYRQPFGKILLAVGLLWGISSEVWASLQDQLLHAVYGGDIAEVQRVLSKGADVNKTVEIPGNPPTTGPLLAVAIQYGRPAIAELLLQHGADVDARREDGHTPLQIAAGSGSITAVELLLQHGADVNARTESGRTPLYIALRYGRPAIVELLLQYGADVHAGAESSGTPLHAAAVHGSLAVVELLLQDGADVYADSWSLLYAAAIDANNRTIVELLLRHGADVNQKGGPDDKTFMEIATERGFVEHVRQQIEALAAEKSQALHTAIAAGDLAAVVAALEAGADVNQKGLDGRTPIFAAASGGHTEIVQLLVAAGANLGAQKSPPATQAGSD